MVNRLRSLNLLLVLLIAAGTVAGLIAAYKRFHVEQANRRIEVAVEWQEVAVLAQAVNQPVDDILTRFKGQRVSTLVIGEDTITTLEQAGAVHPQRIGLPDGRTFAQVKVDQPAVADRIMAALALRELLRTTPPSPGTPTTDFIVPGPNGSQRPDKEFYAPADYINLRTVGLGLPPDAVKSANAVGLRIAGRIGNFPGVTEVSARRALQALSDQGASTVIFSGEEVLGHRGLEVKVAGMLATEATSQVRSPPHPLTPSPSHPFTLSPSLALNYGAVEFGKQKGDEKLSATLRGDFVRVHSIQAAEMGQLDEEEAVDRFVRAAKERNIRFCYVRLLTFAGQNPVEDNLRFLGKISSGIARGVPLTGGGMGFGAARRYPETGVSAFLFCIIGLGTAAGVIWMLRSFCPLPIAAQTALLILLGFGCGIAAWKLGEAGRKIVALIAGIAFPATACLRTFPRLKTGRVPDVPAERPAADDVLSINEQTLLPISTAPPQLADVSAPAYCVGKAVRSIGFASAITSIGIIHVVGLLATRPFMLRANQFLGIKAQHAVPLLVIALCAVCGGVALKSEDWPRYKLRAKAALRGALDEPARFGLLILGIIALAGLMLVIARTGNDAGVGVSGFELKVRAMLDRVLPVRPRTKEFLVGHPAFVLGIAWWWRGRRKLAIPAFVVGSLGQVSLLNTFCHIHTPLIVSLWRDSIGLVIGVLIGIAIFWIVETILPAPSSV